MAVPEITKYAASTLAVISLPSHSVLEVTQQDTVDEFTSPARLSQFLYYSAFLEKRWNISIPALTSAQVTALHTFWTTQKGRAIPFKWTNYVDSTLYYVRFDMKALTFEAIAPGYWSCSLVLRQAHTLEVDVTA